MIEIDSLAQNQANATGHSAQEWKSAIEQATQMSSIGRLTDGEFESLISASNSPEIYATSVELLQVYWDGLNISGDENVADGFEVILDAVDESDFSLNDWLDSLSHLDKWSQGKGLNRDLKSYLGYLGCCITQAQGALKPVLESMLQSNPYEGKS